jgi:hypothetical protein
VEEGRVLAFFSHIQPMIKRNICKRAKELNIKKKLMLIINAMKFKT